MLQTKTVDPKLLELLRKISKDDFFSNFLLVGGTALTLQIGHRDSVDLDFFGKQEIVPAVFLEKLKKFGSVQILSSTKNLFLCNIDGIKVDFVNHIYKFIENPIIVDGIKMATPLDIAAMKLCAIEGRGSRKDFIDLYFLFKYFTLPQMVDAYSAKYVDQTKFMMLKSLTYFEDAENVPQPIMFKDFNWEKAKKKIIEEFLKL